MGEYLQQQMFSFSISVRLNVFQLCVCVCVCGIMIMISLKVKLIWALLLLLFINVVAVIVFVDGQSAPDPNANFDALFRELNILTRQQLEQLQASSPLSNNNTLNNSSSSTNPIINNLNQTQTNSNSNTIINNNNNNNNKQFRLPNGYDRNRAPKFNRYKPIKVSMNLTILNSEIDRYENIIIIDVLLKECWKDKRLRWRPSTNNNDDNADNDNDDIDDIYDDDDINYFNNRFTKHYLLESHYLSKIWHPISRIRNTGYNILTMFDQPTTTTNDHQNNNNNKEKFIEEEKFVQNILVEANVSTALLWLTMKLRINIPLYECNRDDIRMFPFDKIKCSIQIMNARYDKHTIRYEWDHVKWSHNEYHNGKFYLQTMTTSTSDQPIIQLGSNVMHSVMAIDFTMKRQIGDYILNIYILHIFLLLLSILTFFLSIVNNNIIIRLSLSIIILMIIKFQTFQTIIKNDQQQRIITSLSVWSFSLTIMILLSILMHILSYYSHKHKWNKYLLDSLIHLQQQSNNNNSENNDVERQRESRRSRLTNFVDKKCRNFKKNCLVRLNAIIVNNNYSENNENDDDCINNYDSFNMIDMMARVLLSILYTLFVLIYFINYTIANN